MGIQEEINIKTPTEPKKVMDMKQKYIVVKNHVREFSNVNKVQNDCDKSKENNKDENRKLKKLKKNKKERRNSSENEANANSICENDLNELRTVYNNCKAVMKKIETKYGHLLGLNDESVSNCRKRRISLEECQCTFNKKIVYDDEGKELLQDSSLDHHICPTKLQTRPVSVPTSLPDLSIKIEHEIPYELPDSLLELEKMLKEKDLSKYLRYQIIQKIKFIQHEKINLIRYNKPYLIEQLKSNSEDILDFKGANVYTLPGYPVDPIT